MQFILHRVYYKGVSYLFHMPARLPGDTNKACRDVNTSSTLAGGNILLFATKATQDLLTGDPVPLQLSAKSSGMGPSIFNWGWSSQKSQIIPGSQKTYIWCKRPVLRVLRKKAWPLLPVMSSFAWCILRMVNSFGKGGLQESSVKGRAFSYVTTKAPTYITKGFWWSNIFNKNFSTYFRKLSYNACYQKEKSLLVGDDSWTSDSLVAFTVQLTCALLLSWLVQLQ